MRTGWTYRWFWKFLERFWRLPHTLLNIVWVQFVLKNCEILHFVWVLYDKNSPSYYCYTSDVTYKKYEMLVYTLQSCWQDFVKETCRTQKVQPDLFSENSFSRPNLLWSRAIMALKCDRRWSLFFGCIYTAINSTQDFFFTLKSLSLSFPLKVT